MKRNQSGFTLIEIAIVLVIIGLLLGGVMKGQELINSAKVKNLGTDFKNIPVFIYGYQDKYRSLPGDDSCAYDRAISGVVPACTGHLATGSQIPSPSAGNGNGDGALSGAWYNTATTAETYKFWQHVRVASLAPGAIDPSTDYRPVNAAGGRIGIQGGTSNAPGSPIIDSAGNAIRGSYVICSEGILGKFVKQLDLTMDDGNTATGSMLAATTASVASTLGVDAIPSNGTGAGFIDDAASYTVCMGI